MKRFASVWLLLALAALTWPALAFAHDAPENSQSKWVMAD
jgi:hypothetical protein